MTRTELIDKVKIKLEEVSSFDEPDSFIAAAGDSDYDRVKPIISYIDGCLDEAAMFCLETLPTVLLNKDVQTKRQLNIVVDEKGVGKLGIHSRERVIAVKLPIWEHECRNIINTQSQLYLLQQNRYTRGGTAKPIVAYRQQATNQLLELYSFPASYNNTNYYVVDSSYDYIDTSLIAENVQSDITVYIVLECAILVYNILGNANQVKALQEEFNQHLALFLS